MTDPWGLDQPPAVRGPVAALPPDPPGTRGRRARRWAGDDDPWINTD